MDGKSIQVDGNTGLSVKVFKVIMERWRTRLEANDVGNIIVRRWIDTKRGFLHGDNYSPEGFCSTEITIAIILDETDGYRMEKKGKRHV